ADGDRLARFQREAQALAALNHPHIAQIYGYEEAGGVRALAMELVPGEDLAARLARGPIPVDEALPIARQVAEALEAAHEKGIVHRDLKPANVKLDADGRVKVLDFGIAKALAGEGTAAPATSTPTVMPTVTHSGTAAGMILGTAAYMSPEQARGKTVDRRTDVWSFGALLYEMLTGRRAFEGETVTDVLAAVVTRDPDWDALPEETPPAVRRLVRRALVKDARNRLQAIGDARVVLQEAIAGAPEPETPPARRAASPGAARSRALPWALAALFALASLGLGAALWARPPAAPAAATRTIRAAIPPPPGTEFVPIGAAAGPPALSPDGLHLAFVARDAAGTPRLYVQPLATGEPRALEGTEGARRPFWAPDGRALGFSARRQLMRVGLDGGRPVAIAEVSDERGGSWGPDGTILFAPAFDGPIFRVPAAGGEPKPVTALDRSRREGTHRYPVALPDGKHFLFQARGYLAYALAEDAVYVGALDDPAFRVKLVEVATTAAYAAGRLYFVRDATLYAQRFDLERLRLEGEPVVVAQDVRFDPRFTFGVFSVSQNGLIVYQAAGNQDDAELVWLDRRGQRLGRLDGPGHFGAVSISPQGDRVMASVFDPRNWRGHLRVYDLAHGSSNRLTMEQASDIDGVWSPDGKTVAFSRVGRQGMSIWTKPADGSAPERLLYEGDGALGTMSWSADGRHILGWSSPSAERETGLWLIDATGKEEPRRFTSSRFNGDLAGFSPDGRWVVFDSDDSGPNRPYVAAYPDTGGRWQVSDQDGDSPRWSRGMREIVYLADSSGVTAVPVDLSGSAPRFGSPQRLFEAPLAVTMEWRYDVTRDGEKFLFVLPLQEARAEPFTLLVGWEG
ncbi:MAG: serine/threonine-protein kinase, partial [Acidobacteria bacterium]|nr:serine/threonine-protein kinase [Acidobacteriota bacterium]